jgi:hypothetical protein
MDDDDVVLTSIVVFACVAAVHEMTMAYANLFDDCVLTL